MSQSTCRAITWLCAAFLFGTLSACGGGGSSIDECRSIDPTRIGCGATASVSSGTASAAMTLTLTDAAEAPITAVTPQRPGVVKAVLKDPNGKAIAGAVVTFTTTDKTANLVPASGTALTDSAGLARIEVGAGTQAGGFTLTAAATAEATSVTATLGYSVTFPALTLSAINITPATLSAGGNAAIRVTVMNGSSPYTPPLPVIFTSPCVTAGKATLGSPVLTQNGGATASYTDKGCGVPDIITASVTLAGMTTSASGTINVLPATAGSIKFISSDTTNIALKGTGGFGRQEFATLTFQVFDRTGAPLAGTLVDMAFADTNPLLAVGGLTLFPISAISGADGTVTTQVRAGTIPTSVRVVASISGNTITTLSNILVISTGVPDQQHFSLSTSIGNCEGRDFDRLCSIVTARLADHFGNPVPDGTAVNFTAEGGSIGASCVTGSLPPPGTTTPVGQTTNSSVGPGSGACSVEFYASNPRPPNERVTILAYALGEEDFFDKNGNNVYDTTDTFTDKSPDIFRADDESNTWKPGEPCIGSNSNGTCNSPGDGQYNGVLRTDQQNKPPQTLYVSAQLVQLFSGSVAKIQFDRAALTCAPGGTADVQVTLTDSIGNIMPAGTKIEFTAVFAAEYGIVLPSASVVPNVVPAFLQPPSNPLYPVTVGCRSGSGKLLVTVTTPNNRITTASIPIN